MLVTNESSGGGVTARGYRWYFTLGQVVLYPVQVVGKPLPHIPQLCHCAKRALNRRKMTFNVKINNCRQRTDIKNIWF
jgi:hypothetical protein